MGARPLKKLKTVLVSGNFNILHPGHLRLLKFAKECGDRLTVVVMSDSLAGDAAHIREELRLDAVRNIKLVDEAFISYKPIQEVIYERCRDAAGGDSARPKLVNILAISG